MAAITKELPPHSAAVVYRGNATYAVQVSVVLLIACLGAAHLPYPFGGDQALFTLAARAIHGGAALYRDFWDLKQPGIYLFYVTAGSTFGFTEFGIHLFELLYFLVFSVVLQRTLRSTFRSWVSSALVPLLSVGIYYATATQLSLTQVEALAGFPLYLCAFFAIRGAATERPHYYVASAVAGAAVLCLKLLFLPLVIFVLLPAALKSSNRNTGILVAGLALATAAWIGATMSFAGAQIVIATFVTYPLEISRQMPVAPISRLIGSIGTYALGAGVPIVFAIYGLVRRSAQNPWKATAVLWIASALFVIVLQRQSWWEYQFNLLDVPLAILAAFGVDALCESTAEGRRTWRDSFSIGAALVLALLLLPALKPLAGTVRDLTRSQFAFGQNGEQRFAALIDPNVNRTISETRFLRSPAALPGDIYICGNPHYYLAANRGQAVSINGWSMELLVPDQWRELARELTQKRPPYIFIDQYYRPLIPQRSVLVARTIAARYRLLRRSSVGDWYAIRSNSDAAPRDPRF